MGENTKWKTSQLRFKIKRKIIGTDIKQGNNEKTKKEANKDKRGIGDDKEEN